MDVSRSTIDGDKVTAFLVDYGFEREIGREKIFDIPPEFVSVLPFQAIKCALFNVRIAGNNKKWWDEEAGDLLFDLGSADSEIDIMNMGIDDSGQEKTYLVSVQGGRFEHELVLRNLAEYVDENMAPFDGAEIEHANAIQDTHSPQPESEDHVDEEHKLLNILEEMEKASGEPGNEPERPLTAESQEHCTMSMAAVPSLVQPKKARGMPALAVVEGVTQLERRSPPSSVRWHQDRTKKLVIKIDLDLNFNLDQRSCYIHVENMRIEFQYLEIACPKGQPDKVLYYLHLLPPLDLYSSVDPVTTRVVFNPRGVTISMLKSRKVYWKTLAVDPKTKSKIRLPWLKVDHDQNWSNEDDDDDEEEEDEIRNPETLFPKTDEKTAYAALQPDDSEPQDSSCRFVH